MTPELLDPPEEEQDADRTADDGTAGAAAETRPAADALPDDDPSTADDTAETVAIETGAGSATISVPPTATEAEAAAVAAALSTHLDEQADADDAADSTVDRWKLSARFGRKGLGRKRARTARSCSRGSEWKLAHRAW